MTQQFTITRLGHQGDGIADGPVYAPRTLPGEIVSGTLVGQQLTDIRVETPSEHRVKAPCRHYKACGGCQLQHASDAFVADWKLQIVRKALMAQDLEAPLAPDTYIARTVTSAGYDCRKAHEKGHVGGVSRSCIRHDHRDTRLPVA